MFGGAGATVGAFRVKLGLDMNDYARGIIQADSFNAVFGAGVTQFITNPLLGSINALQGVASGLLRHSARVLASAEATQRLSDSTGASTDLLQAMQGRLEQAGYAAEVATQGLNRFNRVLGDARGGNQVAIDQFAALGISLNQLGSTDAALSAVLDAIDRLPDPAQKAAAASKLLGEEAGAKLVNAVGGGSAALRRMIEEQRNLLQVIDSGSVASLANLNTTLGKTQQLLAGFGTVLAAEVIAGFADEANLADVNVERLGERLRTELIPEIRLLAQDVGQIVGDISKATDALGVLVDVAKPILEYERAVVSVFSAAYTLSTDANARNAAGSFIDATIGRNLRGIEVGGLAQ